MITPFRHGVSFALLRKKAKSHQRIERMQRMTMKQNRLNPLNPLTILSSFI